MADAVNRLHLAGVEGPYGIALGPRCYTGLTKTTQGRLSGHGARAAAALSLSGGDFELTAGQDFSIGYLEYTAGAVRLYLQASFTFRVRAAEAAVPLAYAKKA